MSRFKANDGINLVERKDDMQGTRLNLGAAPAIAIESCGGDVEIRGSASGEIVIDNDGAAFDVDTSDEHAALGDISGNCAIRVPEGSQVHIKRVGGQLRIKGVMGSIEIDEIGGDCAARRVGSLRIGAVGGDFQLKRASGDITLGQVGGDVVLRVCDGPVRIESCGGDVSAQATTHGLDVGRAGGDLELRSEIAPESMYRVVANGDVVVRVPADSNVRFALTADGGVRLDSPLQANRDGEQITATLGSGSASIEVNAHGGVRVRLEDNCDCEDDVDVSFTAELDNYTFDVSSRLDSHMRKLETQLNDLPEIVRRRVERKLDVARRHMDSAEKQARRAALHSGHHRLAQPMPSSVSSSEPVTEGERLAILKMLEDGKISVDEAQQLLTALETSA
jgi:DUF4097 and DUF4098 domain-containing protein YvlB